MNTGKELTLTITVQEEQLASNVGSGLARVFATPAMIALMEKVASECVADELEPGMSTVGTHLDVKHLAATPIGMKVSATAKLLEVDKRRLVFEITASDERELIGKGTHERFIVNSEKFMAKADGKLDA